MNRAEKIKYLEENYPDEWERVCEETEHELSDEQPIFCVCGRLATGLHEGQCKKFRKKVISKTLKKMKHLLKRSIRNDSRAIVY